MEGHKPVCKLHNLQPQAEISKWLISNRSNIHPSDNPASQVPVTLYKSPARISMRVTWLPRHQSCQATPVKTESHYA